MADVPQAIAVDGDTYTVPGADTIEPLAVSVHYDGAGAGSTFLPCLSYYSQSGRLISRTYPQSVVAPGGSAEVSFIPFVPPASGASGVGGELAYAQVVENQGLGSNVWATTGVTPALAASTGLVATTGRVKLEAFLPSGQAIFGPGTNDLGFFLDFYMDGVSLTAGNYIAYADTNGAIDQVVFASVVKAEAYFTPSVGLHVFALYAFSQHAGQEMAIITGTGELGSGNPAPAFLRVSEA